MKQGNYYVVTGRGSAQRATPIKAYPMTGVLVHRSLTDRRKWDVTDRMTGLRLEKGFETRAGAMGAVRNLLLKRDLFITENPEHYRKLKQRFSDMLKAATEDES